MPIRITDFSGIVPRLHPERLPENCAQSAINCSVKSGAIEALRIPGSFVSLHEPSGALKAGIPSRDVIQIAKPLAPSVLSIEKLAKPEAWLRVMAYDWVSYIDSGGVRQVNRVRAQAMTVLGKLYSETALYLLMFLPPRFYIFENGGPYFLRGPRYQFIFRTAENGPDQAMGFPATPSEGDPEFNQMSVPLVDENQNIYARFEVFDVSGPRYDEDILVDQYAFYQWWVPGSFVVFRINMNYVQASRQHLYYVSAGLTAHDVEGPPSELSERIVLRPGEKLTLNTPKPRGCPKIRLYRAGTPTTDAFDRVDDVEDNQYTDWKVATQGKPIPPFGNFPGTSKGEFLRGSFIHPAQFGVALYRENLWVSDPTRLHAWPEEYTLPFPGAKAIALTGNSILVFTVDAVYSVNGSNPARLESYLLSRNHPLLNPAGLAQLGQTIIWPTHDGLAATTGGKVEMLTDEHFTREQWQALRPERMRARTADGSIFLEYPEGDLQNLRFDIGEKLAAATRYTTLDGGTFRWHSKEFFFDQPTIIDYVRVQADGPVKLNVYADGQLAETVDVTTDEAHSLISFVRLNSTRPQGVIAVPEQPGGSTVRHARTWSFEVIGDATVRRIEAFERVVHTIADELALTADDTPLWRSTWVAFRDADRFAAGRVLAQTTAHVVLRLFADGILAHSQAITSGRTFALPRTLPKATLWTVDVESPVRVDGLFLTRRTVVDAGDSIREVNDGPYAPWLTKEWKFTDERYLQSVIVHAAQPVRLRLYYDNEQQPSAILDVANAQELRIARARHSSVSFDFDGADASVREVVLFVSRVTPIGVDGITLNNPPSRRGLLFKFADKNAFACGSIGASEYPCTLRLYADGQLAVTRSVVNGKMFFLPRTLSEASLWEVDIEGGGEINRVDLVPWRVETVDGPALRIANPGTVPPWLHTKYLFSAGATRLVSAWVESDKAVRLRLYFDAATSVGKAVLLENRVETLLELTADCGAVSFDFVDDDAAVRELNIFGREVQAGNLSGIEERARANYRMLAWRFADRADMACATVGARAYSNVTLRLLADGRQHFAGAIADGHIVKLPRTRRNAAVWEADVTAPAVGVVDSLVLMPRIGVQSSGKMQLTRSGEIPRWLYERYEFPQATPIKSVIVDADMYPVQLRLYFDGKPEIGKSVTIRSKQETLLATAAIGALELDFDNDGAVRDVTVLPLSVDTVGDGGVQIPNPDSWIGLYYKFPDRGSWACASIGASAYPCAITLTPQSGLAGTETYTVPIPDGAIVSFPRDMVREPQWRVDIDAPGTVTNILLLPWVRTPMDGDAIRVHRSESGVPAWLYTKWQVADLTVLGSLIVRAAAPVAMRFFVDGGTDPAVTIDVPSGAEMRLPYFGSVNEVTFDFNGNDSLVTEVIVFLKTSQQVQGPISNTNVSLRRNLYRFAAPSTFGCGWITTADLPSAGESATLRLYADGALVHTQGISGAFVLPKTLPRALAWEVDIESTANISGFVLFPWRTISFDGTWISSVRDRGTAPEWLYTTYTFPKAVRLRSARLVAKSEVPIDLYVDGAARAKRYLLQPNVETRFDEPLDATTLQFDFAGADGAVDRIDLYAEQIVTVDGGAVVLRPASAQAAWRNWLLTFKDTGSFSVCRLSALQYPVNLRLLSHGLLRASVTIDGPGDFLLTDPAVRLDRKDVTNLPNAKEWELDVCLGTGNAVTELVLMSAEPYALRDAQGRPTNGLTILREQEPFTWLGKRVLADRPVNFSAARVAADAYPVRLRLYGDGRKLTEVFARDDGAFRLPRVRNCREWQIDAVAADGAAIHELSLATSMDGIR